MKVRLISNSQSVDHTNITDMVCYCARVSNPANQMNTETNERLLKYLIKNKHWSPFEMVSICLEIETTRDIARQILRHRSFSFQEFSQRYAIADIGVEYKEARVQDNKQLQIDNYTKEAYNWAIENGIAKEQARAVLPEGMTLSRMYVNGTLRSWIHYIELRSGNGTQKEHREVAVQCAQQIEQIFPLIKMFVSDHNT